MDTLFDLDDSSSFDREEFARRLARFAQESIFIGGSSWKYEGWIGQIYSRSRYLSRGKFSRRLFQDTCLAEYASIFPAVCGDFAFYQFPSEEFWRRLFQQTPAGFRFVFKVPEQITCKVFPAHTRYGAQGGLENPTFLDAHLFREGFLQPLEPYRDKTALLIFEFGTFSNRAFADAAEFAGRLDAFLRLLPPDFRYAVEIRNPDFLVPEYFDCLRSHNIANVYNSWTRMPELQAQLALPASRTADFLVCRALLRRGRSYEEAVQLFSPYKEVREIAESAREGMRELIRIAREEKRITFLFVNNRLEGNAPATIVAITDPSVL